MNRQTETVKSEPEGRQATEFENFTRGLRQILSVKKSDLDLHKPIRPRKPKAKRA